MSTKAVCLIGWFLAVDAAWSESAKGGNHFGLPIAPRDYSSQFFLDVDAAGNVDSESRGMFQAATEAVFAATDSETVTESAGGVSSSGTADYAAMFSLDLNTSVLTGSYSAQTSAVVDNSTGSPQRYSAEYTVDFELHFGVESESATIQIFGSGSASEAGGAANANVAVLLEGDTEFELLIMPSNGTESRTIGETLELGPGSYFLRFLLEGEVFSSESNDASVNAESELSINVTITPSDTAQTITWNTDADGGFDQATNWDPQLVPGSAQTAIFDRDANYTVTIGTEESARAVVERGNVIFGGTSYTLSGGDENTGSLVVGSSSEDRAQLALTLSQLNTVHAVIADAADTDGDVLSFGGTVWTNQGRLTVGRNGVGTIDITNLGTVNTAELRLGDGLSGDGTITIVGVPVPAKQSVNRLVADSTAIGLNGTGELIVQDAFIETGQTEIGSLPTGIGVSTIGGGSDVALWNVNGPLFVGNEGMGTLEVERGGVVNVTEANPMAIANVDGSAGVVEVGGFLAQVNVSGALTVGLGGDGTMTVENEGKVTAGSMRIGPVGVNPPEDARGLAIVHGMGTPGEEPHLDVSAGDLIIGENGEGGLTLLNEAYALSNATRVGTGEGGDGSLIVNSSLLETTDVLFVGQSLLEEDTPTSGVVTLVFGEIQAGAYVQVFGGSTVGIGTIHSPVIEIFGQVAPGVTLDNSKGAADEPIGMLTFDGDAVLDRAVITVEARSESEFDQLVVTGAANFTDTTIHFVFIDGYLPQTGDTFPFLNASSITMDANTTYTYTGAAPGFEFEVTEVGGALMFTAQSDAQPHGGGGEGEGEGDGGCSMVLPNAADALSRGLGIAAALFATMLLGITGRIRNQLRRVPAQRFNC